MNSHLDGPIIRVDMRLYASREYASRISRSYAVVVSIVLPYNQSLFE
jgi:hypothetical protein